LYDAIFGPQGVSRANHAGGQALTGRGLPEGPIERWLHITDKRMASIVFLLRGSTGQVRELFADFTTGTDL
jgi:hypothetical protein